MHPSSLTRPRCFPGPYLLWVPIRPNALSRRAITTMAKQAWPRLWSTFADRAAVSLLLAEKTALAKRFMWRIWAYPRPTAICSLGFPRQTFACPLPPRLYANEPRKHRSVLCPRRQRRLFQLILGV